MAFSHTVADVLSTKRCIMYLTGQHNVVPNQDLLSEVTHVALAFMRSNVFNTDENPSEWPLFTTVEKARSHFLPGTKIMVAIGGWGDTAGFEEAAATADSRERWVRNVAAMVQAMGADGVDIDWEYPGGNGEDYKEVPNSEKEWQIEAYPLLLEALRRTLGPSKLISAAVPGLRRDLIAFTESTTPRIADQLDFINVMTYDLMNRRDNVTKHHTGVSNSLAAIDAYLERGVPAEKLNLGFAFYVKWVETGPCPDPANPVGCPTLLLEDPEMGADLGRTGGFSWHDPVPEGEAASFARALKGGRYDEREGGHYYWDEEEHRWWTFDTLDAILRKFPLIVDQRALGGVFAWGLGEDAPKFEHLQAVSKGLRGERERTRAREERMLPTNDEL
ncbi:chitinase 18-4 [Sodiomyces alkalinus F11]|uniref:chitinase n=1 Tax=Sodiomyces alkalinus (strain CBS 110278 / VKM F-3762 / F11) TaxID=1314773 RepID=A0A3N2PPY4_SODAK|nr:chitinase 18-4 [Sodiomyces alkalinus F11]ROT36555.1 chitinase 18-4 [Sodiomyces alkalinus F11]